MRGVDVALSGLSWHWTPLPGEIASPRRPVRESSLYALMRLSGPPPITHVGPENKVASKLLTCTVVVLLTRIDSNPSGLTLSNPQGSDLILQQYFI